MTFDAIVLAGGSSTRLDGRDKAAIEIDGKSLLGWALDATHHAESVVVVGPQRDVGRDVIWIVEEPPGAGPAAAIKAGLESVTSELVAVLAVDMPLVSSARIEKLMTSVDEHDGACFVDERGRAQYLAAVYRTRSLRRVTARDLQGSSVRKLLGPLDVVGVVDPEAAMDCDTPEDVDRLRDYFLTLQQS
ncbi:MAG: molybdenum cofactor guanylyltransferase [Actinomycetota bacterium]